MSMKNTNILLAMALMMGGNMSDISQGPIDIEPKNAPLPKGVKDYWFAADGRFANDTTKPMRKDETVFHCIAVNDKSAKKKFKKWCENQVL